VPPSPGTTPSTMPKTVDFSSVTHSLSVHQMPLMRLPVVDSALAMAPSWLASRIISATAKTPMKAATRLMPS
jgi:hypothetical protein